MLRYRAGGDQVELLPRRADAWLRTGWPRLPGRRTPVPRGLRTIAAKFAADSGCPKERTTRTREVRMCAAVAVQHVTTSGVVGE